MRASIFLGLLALLGAAPLQGSPDSIPPLRLAPGSTLWVSGKATIGSFTCKTSTIRLQPTGPAAETMSQADLRVPANKLSCGNPVINSHMRATLRAQDHPEIALRLTFPERAWSSTGEDVVLEGTLTLGGTERPATVAARVEPGEDGSLRVRGTYSLLLSDHGLRTPSFLMKLLTVGDRVTVRFDLGLLR